MMMIKKKRIEQSTLTLFQQTLDEEEDDKEEEGEREDTYIRLLAQPTNELLGLIGDDDTTADEAIR